MLRTILALAALAYAAPAMAQPCSQFRFWKDHEECETKDGKVCTVTQINSYKQAMHCRRVQARTH